MTYKEYPNCTKTFVVVHKTGFGVQEAPYIEKEVVFESDDEQIAQTEADRLTKENNEPDCGSWKENTYWINVNTLTEQGKKLIEEFHSQFDERLKKGLEESKYNVMQVGDRTYYTDKAIDEMFVETKDGPPL